MSRFVAVDAFVVNVDHIVYFVEETSDSETEYVLIKMRDGTTLRSYGETTAQFKARLEAKEYG